MKEMRRSFILLGCLQNIVHMQADGSVSHCGHSSCYHLTISFSLDTFHVYSPFFWISLRLQASPLRPRGVASLHLLCTQFLC